MSTDHIVTEDNSNENTNATTEQKNVIAGNNVVDDNDDGLLHAFNTLGGLMEGFIIVHHESSKSESILETVLFVIVLTILLATSLVGLAIFFSKLSIRSDTTVALYFVNIYISAILSISFSIIFAAPSAVPLLMILILTITTMMFEYSIKHHYLT